MAIPIRPTSTSPKVYVKYQPNYETAIAFAAIRIVEVPKAGDFDTDGDVDGADFLRWQRGASPNPVGAGDLASWKAKFGAAVPVSTAVPEPATLLTALVGAGCVSLLGRAVRYSSARHAAMRRA